MGVLDDKVAIVTGSARGIGRATAEILSEHGAKVVINDLDGDLAEQTASEIAGETAVYAGDLTRPDAADELVAAAIDAWGKLDIIVNNAGYTVDAPIHKMTDDAFQKMLDIHAVAFGYIETRLTASKDESNVMEIGGEKVQLGIPDQMRGMASMLIPLGRPGTPQEAAGGVFFLCSPWSNFVHGQVLNITGGQFTGMTT